MIADARSNASCLLLLNAFADHFALCVSPETVFF
jgi:hypothetical protein